MTKIELRTKKGECIADLEGVLADKLISYVHNNNTIKQTTRNLKRGGVIFVNEITEDMAYYIYRGDIKLYIWKGSYYTIND